MTLVVCYLPFLITQALTPQRGMPLSVYLAKEFTGTVVLLNSSLNPSLYCWKIREVRQSVKDTMRELFMFIAKLDCYIAREFFPTSRALIGYLQVSWSNDETFFPPKSLRGQHCKIY